MAMTSSTTSLRGLTWQQFLDLPDDPALRHAELINGEVVVTIPSVLHQRVVGLLVTELNLWIRAGAHDERRPTDARRTRGGRGEATMDPAVQIADDRGYLPDIAWYSEGQCSPRGQPPGFIGPPRLVVEVLSPSTRRLDTVRKRNDYARIGVRELWLIDPDVPEALITRISSGPGDEAAGTLVDAADVDRDGMVRSPLLPDFAVRLGDLIER